MSVTDTIRVLHVDDDAEFTDLVSTFLEREDARFHVETAADADEGLDRLPPDSFDCIVADYEMPGRDGIEFLRAVREDHPSLPFILLTGKGSEEIASDAISAGVTDYLQKGSVGSQFKLLANRIRNAVAQYRSEQAQQVLVELAESTNRIIFVYSREFTELLFVTSAYDDVWGRASARLREEPTDFLEGVHPDDRERVREAMVTVSAGEPVELEFRVDAGLEYDRWVQLRGEPIFDEAGDVVRVAGFGADVTEEHRRRMRRDRQRDTLIDLATDEAVTTGDFDRALRRITETAAEVLEVARVNVWLVDADDPETLVCADHFDRRTDEHDEGMSLVADAYPSYFAALETHRAIAADDARTDPRTAELTDDYLDVYGVGALLDGTLRSGGEVVGMVCHEHVGEPRTWTEDEVEFAGDVADVVYRALRNHEQAVREEELRKTSARLEALLENSPDIIDVLDTEGTVLDVNRRFCTELGYTESEVVGRPIWEINHEFDAAELRAFLDSFSLGERRKFESVAERKDGSTLPIEVHLIRLDIDGEDHFLAISRDITERTEYERRLQAQNERLEDFASVVSHDLRNPLAVAVGQVHLARDDCESAHLDAVERAHSRMNTLIDDLLTLAREGTDAADVRPTPLADVAAASWRNVDTGEATLRVATDRTVLADRCRLQQLFENLFRNAVEHGSTGNRRQSGDAVERGATTGLPASGTGGPTNVRSRPDGEAGDRMPGAVTVTVGDLADGFFVEDDGPGIPRERREEVFDVGYSTSTTGTGFGLSIVEKVATAHGWDVQATDGEDGGARFEVTGVSFAGR